MNHMHTEGKQPYSLPSLGDISTSLGLVGIAIGLCARFLSLLPQSESRIYDKLVMLYGMTTVKHYIESSFIFLFAMALTLFFREIINGCLKIRYVRLYLRKSQRCLKRNVKKLYVRFILLLMAISVACAVAFFEKSVIYLLLVIYIALIALPKIPFHIRMLLCGSIFVMLFLIAIAWYYKDRQEKFDVIAYTEIIGNEKIPQNQMLGFRGQNLLIKEINGSMRSIPLSSIKFVDFIPKAESPSPSNNDNIEPNKASSEPMTPTVQ